VVSGCSHLSDAINLPVESNEGGSHDRIIIIIISFQIQIVFDKTAQSFADALNSFLFGETGICTQFIPSLRLSASRE
jgi:hypothetical protein